MKRCEKGHYFDRTKHSSCPYCGVADLDLGPTRVGEFDPKAVGPNRRRPAVADNLVQRGRPDPGTSARETAPSTDGVATPPVVRPVAPTIGALERRLGSNPVVGWLVCTAGPDRGRDFRLTAGKNRIGRDPANAVCVPTDSAISRHDHATVSFDAVNGVFHLLPGSGTELVYQNGQAVYAPAQLGPRDRIRMGETELLFVPLCGEGFRWE